MTRRGLIAFLPALSSLAAGSRTIRGRLRQEPNQPPALLTAGGGAIPLEGDAATLAVLRDRRLAAIDVELLGHYVAGDRFQIDPFHTQALFVLRGGKRLTVSYWCEVCAIRTYTPGPCPCCQEEMALDLREAA